MTTITKAYKDMNADLHHRNPGFGCGGWRWLAPAAHFANITQSKSVLDYGAGKQSFQKWWPHSAIEVTSYDPAIEGIDAPPAPHDFVACLDVLEHIEPELLDATLRDIRRCTQRAALLVISTRPANKKLPDGRNAHLIVQPKLWWEKALLKHFRSLADIGELHPELAAGEEYAVLCYV